MSGRVEVECVVSVCGSVCMEVEVEGRCVCTWGKENEVCVVCVCVWCVCVDGKGKVC